MMLYLGSISYLLLLGFPLKVQTIPSYYFLIFFNENYLLVLQAVVAVATSLGLERLAC
jgi:hypothetical protein